MQTELINQAPSWEYALIIAITICVLAFFHGRSVVQITRIVINDGITPNAGFITKTIMFLSTLVTSYLIGTNSNNIVLAVVMGGIGTYVVRSAGDQGRERL